MATSTLDLVYVGTEDGALSITASGALVPDSVRSAVLACTRTCACQHPFLTFAVHAL